MPLTLREAMTLVEPLRLSRVVGGEGGLDNVVQSVNVMEVPDILEWVHPGELLVTTMYPLRDDAAAIEALVPRLADKGLAGLAVTPSGYMDEFPPAMVRAANERSFPLIELPQRVSFIDIIQPITSEILRLQARELIQSVEIHRQFIDLVLSGGTYRDIAQGIAQRVHRPVTIVDRFRRVLGEGFLMGETSAHKPFLRDEAGGDRYLNDLYRPRALAPMEGSEAVLRVVEGPAGSVEHVACPVLVGPMTLGEIIVWGPWADPPSSMDLIVVQHGTTVAALKMMEARSIAEAEERFRNEILEGLLSSSPDERGRAIQQSNDLGNRLAPPYAVVLVGPDRLRGTTLTKVESIEKRNLDSSLHLSERYIRILQPAASFWYQGPRLVVFLPLPRPARAESRARLVQELQTVCDRIRAENAPYTVSMGVSPGVFDLDDFRSAYECARQSLQIGSAQEAGGTGRVTHYEDLGLFRVVSVAENPAGVERFCLDAIGPLLAYDRENDANLAVTLRSFLEHNQNSAKTAKLLFVHYNTLRYRIDRAKEILGDFSENPQQRLEIELALQLYPLIGRFPPAERPR
ncbi:MAG TPA: PucR family transcriptional regulator ligand-binding domain-containing protein [Anaerolineales bacterium]|nr:PucR family transcriptional regulator ligand-binding domain-containing protein [Anaerolineales bacterium]